MLKSASSDGDLEVVRFGDVEMLTDLVRLNNEAVSLNDFTFKSVNVTKSINVINTVNGQLLLHLDRNSFKISGNQTLNSSLVMMRDLRVTGDLLSTGLINGEHLDNLVTLSTDQTLQGNYSFDCVQAEDLSVRGLVTQINLSEWRESAVLTDADQEITGAWSVTGTVELRGPVHGRGRLGDTDLTALTHHVLYTLTEMKGNLSSACEAVNKDMVKAQQQSVELQYLESTQEVLVSPGVSAVLSFQCGDNDYLAVSDKGCSTTLLKWSKEHGRYARLFDEQLGAVGQMAALQHDHQTYLITSSTGTEFTCSFTGGHLWQFQDDRLLHIASLELAPNESIQVYSNYLFSKDDSNVYKWDLFLQNSTLRKTRIEVDFDTAGTRFVPEGAGLGLTLLGENKVLNLDSDLVLSSQLSPDCLDQVQSVSLDPTRAFMALVTAEPAQVQGSDHHIKLYRVEGGLYDEVTVQHVSHLDWLTVPNQTWLVFLQNHSSTELYHLQDVRKGLKRAMSVRMEAESVMPLTLPLESRVNPQPYLLVQTSTSVRVLQAILQGDPFPGQPLSCAFDDLPDITPTPDTL